MAAGVACAAPNFDHPKHAPDLSRVSVHGENTHGASVWRQGVAMSAFGTRGEMRDGVCGERGANERREGVAMSASEMRGAGARQERPRNVGVRDARRGVPGEIVRQERVARVSGDGAVWDGWRGRVGRARGADVPQERPAMAAFGTCGGECRARTCGESARREGVAKAASGTRGESARRWRRPGVASD